MLIRYKQIGVVSTETGDWFVMEDESGERIELSGREGWADTMAALSMIPKKNVFQNQALFGLMYYDSDDHKLRMYPCSIVTGEGIVRLLY